jgi:hypothetical protein
MTLIFTAVLQAQNRLRLAFTCSLIAACACLPAIGIAGWGKNTQTYVWVLACGQTAAATAAAFLAQRFLRAGWWKHGVLVPIFVAGSAVGVVLLAVPWSKQTSETIRLLIDSALFGIVGLALMRGCFPGLLREVILRLPLHSHLAKALRL